ncbi:protein translocase subunit SecD [Candidatus Uhrbacteria bacterium]|nr:protein translocase subunit SecD [Candidatus Uhrbacteria bacterium]
MALTSRRSVRWIVILLFIAGIAAAFFDFPHAYNQGMAWLQQKTGYTLPATRDFRPFHFGLDIQGGTHLVYQADISRLGDADVSDAVNGVRDIIERRVNAFGVAEPTVQTDRAGDAWRIIAELPGVKDIEKAIQLIGETPVLEFREQNTEGPRALTDTEKKDLADFNAKAKEKATAALRKVLAGKTDFADVAKEFSEDTATKEKGGALGFIQPGHPLYTDAQRIGLGRVNRTLIDRSEGYFILRVDNVRDGQREVQTSHILSCFTGTERCERETTKEDALKEAMDIRKQVTPKNFSAMAKEHSTEPAAKESGGSLGWVKDDGRLIPEFTNAALALKVGQISQPVETQFGYHLIYVSDARVPKEYDVRQILLTKKTENDIRGPVPQWKTTALSGKHLKRASVQQDQTSGAIEIKLQFTKEGSEIFAEVTKRNVGKPLGIFLDGKSIVDTDDDRIITDNDLYAPIVQTEITGGEAVITGVDNGLRAKEIARRLNSGALPVPITLIAQQTVGATLGAESITRSLVAGLVGFALVALFMILYYRLPGVLAVLALLWYAVVMLLLFKLIPVTLTLPGIAGFILTIGMAVDANVLIFERMKEELAKGASLSIAIQEGFRRAWPSIRDGNLTTLLAAAIMFWFSSGPIRGFALTLFIGVCVSMLSALTVSRYLLTLVAPWISRMWFWGAKQ